MTQPDPHWLELLKASGWQTAAGAIACGALLWANHNGWFPDAFNSWVGPIAVAMAICGSLALASLASRFDLPQCCGKKISLARKRVPLIHYKQCSFASASKAEGSAPI
jgi:hypothetical protein